MSKAAIVVLADTETSGELGRIVNALTTAKEFKEAGDEVAIVFDGAGTKWIGELSESDHKYSGLFESDRDRIDGACEYCSNVYGVRKQVEDVGVDLLGDYEQHPSLRSYMNNGYQVITF